MATIKDIARECGVSANTISSVINNKSGEVSEKTRSRVLEAMTRLNYRPNASARRMVGKKTNTVGIADRYLDTPYSDTYKTQILGPLVHAARRSGKDILYYSGHANDKQIGSFPSFLDGRCDGLICFSGSIVDEEIDAMVTTKLPLIFIGETHTDHGAVIDIDNAQGAFLAVEHLITLGHRRIGMMQGLGIAGNNERVTGWRTALQEYNIAPDDSMLYPTDAWQKSGYNQALEIFQLASDQRPTAIFCFNDAIALGVLRAAIDKDVHVPSQMSIVGFDNIYLSATSSPPLTTVQQPFEYIAQRTVEILVGMIDGSVKINHKELVAPQLMVRASTAPPHML